MADTTATPMPNPGAPPVPAPVAVSEVERLRARLAEVERERDIAWDMLPCALRKMRYIVRDYDGDKEARAWVDNCERLLRVREGAPERWPREVALADAARARAESRLATLEAECGRLREWEAALQPLVDAAKVFGDATPEPGEPYRRRRHQQAQAQLNAAAVRVARALTPPASGDGPSLPCVHESRGKCEHRRGWGECDPGRRRACEAYVAAGHGG